MEAAVEEGRLEHHVRPGPQRLNGFGMLGPQGGAVHRGGGRDVVHTTAGGGIPRAELIEELVQDLVLVDVTTSSISTAMRPLPSLAKSRGRIRKCEPI